MQDTSLLVVLRVSDFLTSMRLHHCQKQGQNAMHHDKYLSDQTICKVRGMNINTNHKTVLSAMIMIFTESKAIVLRSSKSESGMKMCSEI